MVSGLDGSMTGSTSWVWGGWRPENEIEKGQDGKGERRKKKRQKGWLT
jgi:hypothetical protein